MASSGNVMNAQHFVSTNGGKVAKARTHNGDIVFTCVGLYFLVLHKL